MEFLELLIHFLCMRCTNGTNGSSKETNETFLRDVTHTFALSVRC